MHARDAAGRRVSLLNDDDSGSAVYYAHDPYVSQRSSYAASYARSASSSPNTPELLRSDSYDSQMSNDPMSPITPMYDYSQAYAHVSDSRSPYEDYAGDAHTAAYLGAKQAPSAYSDRRSASYDTPYDDDAATSPAPAVNDRPGKRYPCRYRDSHGCEKTFTTSGHASRHSKIHTAEKAVQCVFHGCPKKFTRADNMKQHLETHYKDKTRSSARPSLSGSDRSKSSSTSKSESRKVRAASSTTPLPSPSGAWDMRGLNLPLLSRPSAARTPSSGLDALAMAVACQEGA